MEQPFSLYVHIPYCVRKCPYCDFNSIAAPRIPAAEYCAALLRELETFAAAAPWAGRPVRTIYFGGGTPSLIEPRLLGEVIAAARGHFPFAGPAEVTLEANPGTVSGDTLYGLRRAGFNRLSLGAQSFQPTLLKTLERIHSAEEIDQAVALARTAGFENLNLDLMYGIPGESEADLEQDLAAITALAPSHISAYCLTIEHGTPFAERAAAGSLAPPGEEHLLEMTQRVSARLQEQGYRRYEISNFAHQGCEARHNLAYWNGEDYLGIGAGAHSYSRSSEDGFGVRWANEEEPTEYMRETTRSGRAPAWRETLAEEEAITEFFLVGLRKVEGVSLEGFEQRFRKKTAEVFPGVIETLCANGLLVQESGQLRLSQRGLLLADTVIEHFALLPEQTA